MNVKPEAISVQSAAILLDVHENTVYAWIRSGVLTAVRTGPRLLRIPRSEISRLRSHGAIRPQQATVRHNC